MTLTNMPHYKQIVFKMVFPTPQPGDSPFGVFVKKVIYQRQKTLQISVFCVNHNLWQFLGKMFVNDISTFLACISE